MDLAVITAVVSAVSVANYFFYKLYTVRLSQIEKRLEKLNSYIEELDRKVDKLNERVVRLEAIINSRKA